MSLQNIGKHQPDPEEKKNSDRDKEFYGEDEPDIRERESEKVNSQGRWHHLKK
jgi:hypothetical protein